MVKKILLLTFLLAYEVGLQAISIQSTPKYPQLELQLDSRDLNGDNIDDIIGIRNKQLVVLLGTPEGFVEHGQLYGKDVRSAHIFDFNGDEILDIAIGEKENITIYLNDGFALFKEAINIFSQHPVLIIKSGDMDNDGDIDFVYQSRSIVVVLNKFNETGKTKVSQSLEASKETSLFLADVDGDCSLDIISPPKCYLNDGSGTFIESPYERCRNPVRSKNNPTSARRNGAGTKQTVISDDTILRKNLQQQKTPAGNPDRHASTITFTAAYSPLIF